MKDLKFDLLFVLLNPLNKPFSDHFNFIIGDFELEANVQEGNKFDEMFVVC
jgi:hypothetical protein